MKLLHSFPALAFGLVLLAILGLCIAQQSVGMLLTAGTLAALSWVITEGPRGWILPRWASNLCVIAASVFVVADLYQNRDDVMGVLGRFAVALTLIKLYERRTARDHAHLLTLSLLLMMTGCLQSNDLLFGVVLLLYAGLGLYVLLLHQLYASFERSRHLRQAVIPSAYRLLPPLKPIIGQGADLHFRTLSVAVAMAGVGLSILVFVLFPREVGADMFGTLQMPVSSRVTRFAWEIDLARGGRVTESRVKVGSVKLLDSSGTPLPDRGPLLLRGEVLDQYQGDGRWTAGPGRPRGVEVSSAGFTPLLSGVIPSGAITQRIVLNRPAVGRTPLFSLYAPLSVSADNGSALIYDPAKQTLATAEESRRLLGYSVNVIENPAGETLAALTNQIPPRGRQDHWFVDTDGAVTELARRLLAEAGLATHRPEDRELRYRWNREAAAAMEAHLQSPSFSYTTDLSSVVQRGDSRDPVTRFLTETRRGHCEFFASAMVALCHTVGIPARVVVGYVAFEYDQAAQQYNIHESGAHAWAEVWTGRNRWQTFDPTPPAALRQIHEVQSTLGEGLRSVYEQLEGGWSNNVVGFDSVSQNRLSQTINQGWNQRLVNMYASIRDQMEQVNMFFNVGPGGYIWMGIVATALIIAIIALITLMRRSRALRRTLHLGHLQGGEYQRMLRQLGFYLDMLGVLHRGGIPKPSWQPPLHFAAGLQQSRPDLAPVIREITDVFYAARYGGQDLDRAERERATELVLRLSAQLRVRA